MRTMILMPLFLVSITAMVFNDNSALRSKWGLPESPFGERAAVLLEAISRTDVEYTRALIDENFAEAFKSAFSVEKHIEQLEKMSESLGEFEVARLSETSDLSAELTLRGNESGRRYKLSVELQAQEPHLIESVSFRQVGGYGIKPLSKSACSPKACTQKPKGSVE